MKPINSLPPFKRFCVTIGNLPSSYVDSMSYYECIMWLCKYLKDTVVPAVNENAETVNELINWFNNLDVQDEIDTKLDEMVESGELQEIISEYLNSQAIFGYNTVSDMKVAENLINGSYAKTLGYHTKNDGGSALYKIRTITNEDIVDEMTIIALSDETLVAEYIKEKYIDPKQFGAYGDGDHDDINPIQKAVDTGIVKFSNGQYKISNAIELPSDYLLDGNNCTLLPYDDNYAIKVQGNGVLNAKQQINIKNFNIRLNLGGAGGLYIKDGYFIYIDNINVGSLNHDNQIGFNIINGFNHVITNSRVNGNISKTGQIGLNISSTNNNDGIENMTNCKYDTLLLQRLDYGVKCDYLTTANIVEFNNIGFSDNLYCFYIDGYASPIKITNTRMEGGRNSSTELVGYYIGENIQLTIDTLNAYNINSVIKSYSTSTLNLLGTFILSGTNQTSKYKFIKIAKANVEIFGSIKENTNTYYLATSDSFADVNGGLIARGQSIGSSSSANSLNINNSTIEVKELTGTELLNTYGQKGSSVKIWTKVANFNVYGSGSSSTHQFSTTVQLTPYKLYTLYMIDNNKAIIED